MDVWLCWRAGEDGENRQTDKWITEWLRLGGVIKKITQLKPLCWGLVASPSSLAINASKDEQDGCNAALVSSMQKTEGLWGQRKGNPLLLLITGDGSGAPGAWSGGDSRLGRGRVFPSRVLQARTPRASHPSEQGRSPQPQLGCEDGDPPHDPTTRAGMEQHSPTRHQRIPAWHQHGVSAAQKEQGELQHLCTAFPCCLRTPGSVTHPAAIAALLPRSRIGAAVEAVGPMEAPELMSAS